MSELPLLFTESGYRIPDTEIFLDPTEPVRIAVISHAHGDHAISGHGTVYCTQQTAELMRARFRYVSDKVVTVPFHEPFDVNGVKFLFTPAGHILGSAQVVWEAGNKRILYTGDIKRQPDATCEPFFTTACDVLITESTFSGNRQNHPDPQEAVLSLKKYGDVNLIIGAYSIGKAQRLSRMLTDLLPEKDLSIHPKIVPYHHVYETAGMNIGKWQPYNRRNFRHTKNCIYLVPPGVLQSYIPSPFYLRGMSSGWDHLGTGLDFLLPVSDHAGFDDLVLTIQESGAKEVYTVHGDGLPLINDSRLAGIAIKELKGHDPYP